MSDDYMITIAKSAPTSRSKAQWYAEIVNRCEEQRSVGQNRAVAFAHYVERHPDGTTLYQAYRQAPGPDWHPPEQVTKVAEPRQTSAMSKLEEMAEDVRATNPELSKAQAFTKALLTPRGQELYRQDKAERLGMAAA